MSTPSARFGDGKYPALFEQAAAIRAHREAFLEEVAASDLSLDAIFERAEADPVLDSMKVLGVIEAMNSYGKVQTRRAFGDLGISEAGHIGQVTPEQRSALPTSLQKHAR